MKEKLEGQYLKTIKIPVSPQFSSSFWRMLGYTILEMKIFFIFWEAFTTEENLINQTNFVNKPKRKQMSFDKK